MIIDKQVKHYYQAWLNCWPTSLRMIATKKYKWKRNSFFDDICSLGKTWTTIYNLAEGAMLLNFSVVLFQNWKINYLKNYIKQWYSIIVLYSFSGWIIWHYSVVKKITKTHIYLLDPMSWIKKYTIEYFYSIWNTIHKDWKQNFLAIK